jgi:hypothetical protein
MYVREIRQLTEWIEREIVQKGVQAKYDALYQAFNTNAQPNQKQPFEKQRNDLVGTIRTIRFDGLTSEQTAYLYNLFNVGSYVGDDGLKNLEELLYRNAMDVANAAQKTRQIVKQIQAGITRANQLKECLQGIDEAAGTEAGDVLIRVRFVREAAMAHVVDLKKWGETWHDIARGIAMLHDKAPEEIRVVGATTGSIILDLAATYLIARTASAILLEALKVAHRYLEIMTEAQRVRGLKIANDKAAAELESAAQKERERQIETIVENVIKLEAIATKVDGEKKNALAKSVEKLVNFVQRGGEVDFVMPKTAEADADAQLTKDRKELTDRVVKIHELENTIQLLTDKSAEK